MVGARKFKDFSAPNYLIENFQRGDNIRLLFAGNIGEAQTSAQ